MKTYEPGMKIKYDPRSKRVVVAFRGRITVLPGEHDTEALGIAAGEAHCRTHGWDPSPNQHAGHRRVRSLF